MHVHLHVNCNSTVTLEKVIFLCFIMLLGSQTVFRHRQVVGEDYAEGARDAERRQLLRWRRNSRSAAASPPGTARSLSEVAHRVRKMSLLENIIFYMYP